MKICSCSESRQDTVKNKNIVSKDSVWLKSDSVSIIKIHQLSDSVPHKIFSASRPVKFEYTDTTSVCSRNIIADITFYDSANVVTKIESFSSNRFPVLFVEKNMKIKAEAKASLVKHLKTGLDLPSQYRHDDWIIGIILISAFLFSLVRKTSKSILPGIYRFFLFKGITDPASRDIGGLFQRKSAIPNIISFFSISLFIYYAASYYNLIPAGISGILFWLICVAVLTTVVFLRHIVCVITGYMSGEKYAFREYLSGVYQFYRFSAIFLFVLFILMSYTMILPIRDSFKTGVAVIGILYLIRIFRLLIIFLNMNISIFYLILYLCALEFLPVVISVKYFTGLV
jgi:hypothetical protein